MTERLPDHIVQQALEQHRADRRAEREAWFVRADFLKSVFGIGFMPCAGNSIDWNRNGWFEGQRIPDSICWTYSQYDRNFGATDEMMKLIKRDNHGDPSFWWTDGASAFLVKSVFIDAHGGGW